jgi:hypothetical protein
VEKRRKRSRKPPFLICILGLPLRTKQSKNNSLLLLPHNTIRTTPLFPQIRRKQMIRSGLPLIEVLSLSLLQLNVTKLWWGITALLFLCAPLLSSLRSYDLIPHLRTISLLPPSASPSLAVKVACYSSPLTPLCWPLLHRQGRACGHLQGSIAIPYPLRPCLNACVFISIHMCWSRLEWNLV